MATTAAARPTQCCTGWDEGRSWWGEQQAGRVACGEVGWACLARFTAAPLTCTSSQCRRKRVPGCGLRGEGSCSFEGRQPFSHVHQETRAACFMQLRRLGECHCRTNTLPALNPASLPSLPEHECGELEQAQSHGRDAHAAVGGEGRHAGARGLLDRTAVRERWGSWCTSSCARVHSWLQASHTLHAAPCLARLIGCALLSAGQLRASLEDDDEAGEGAGQA